MSIKKKYRKLLRNPKLFFSDMLIKHYKLIDKVKDKKEYNGQNKFTVVSAVYGVEKYLDDYFQSMVNQSLDFERHIHLVMVDDGSLDYSPEIIKKWQDKYPNNITYIYKKNGGQASARNVGLANVSTEWVTFIDPDDYISKDYFLNIDACIKQDKSIDTVVCNLVFFSEVSGTISDSHPLKYRFITPQRKIKLSDLKHDINMSVSLTLFRMSKIRKYNLIFDVRVKPAFEDAKFVMEYQSFLSNISETVFIKNSLYYYRKRELKNSTLDTSMQLKERYTSIYEYAHLSILRLYKNKKGRVPYVIQKGVLYDLMWVIRAVQSKPGTIGFLQEDEKLTFKKYLFEIFKYIDAKIILEFNLAGSWFFHKVALLGYFKAEKPPFQIAYIDDIDLVKKEILISYLSYLEDGLDVMINGQSTVYTTRKINENLFLDEHFVYKIQQWIPYQDGNDIVNLMVGNVLTHISLGGKHFREVSINQIKSIYINALGTKQDNAPWLLADRDIQADDNAEHLYRYIARHHPEQKIFFALNKSSIDWFRLKQEGFNLIDFGSRKFSRIYKQSSLIISSHADQYITNYFNVPKHQQNKFVFLQHGVTHSDLSTWLNSKANLVYTTACTPEEYNEFVRDYSKYSFTIKSVGLTGFCRHDTLSNKVGNDNIIVVMPTWRMYLVGMSQKNTSSRGLNDKFDESLFFKYWYSFLHNQKFQELVEKFNYKVILHPHFNILPYINLFKVPEYIYIWQPSDGGFQELFKKASMMITDYSSVAFEMGVLEKPVLYYQFDIEEFYQSHSVQKGYFDYVQHGFGPVSFNEKQLISNLESLLINNGRLPESYLLRMQDTFPFKDGNNCKRVYESLVSLLESNSQLDKNIFFRNLENIINNAKDALDYSVFIKYMEKYIEIHSIEFCNEDLLNFYCLSLYEEGKYQPLIDILNSLSNFEFKHYWLSKLYVMKGDWQLSIDLLSEYDTNDFDINLLLMISHSELNNLAVVENINYSILLSTTEERVVWDFYYLYCSKQWLILLDRLQKFLEDIDNHSLNHKNLLIVKKYKLHLLLAKTCLKLHRYERSLLILSKYEISYRRNDADCRKIIASVAFMLGNFAKSLYQIQQSHFYNTDWFADEYKFFEQVSLFKMGKDVETNVQVELVYGMLFCMISGNFQILTANSFKKLNDLDRHFILNYLFDNGHYSEMLNLAKIAYEMGELKLSSQLRTRIFYISDDWLALTLLDYNNCSTIEELMYLLVASTSLSVKAKENIIAIAKQINNDFGMLFELTDNKKALIDHIEKILSVNNSIYFLKQTRLEVFVAKLYMEEGNIREAQLKLADYELHTRNDPVARKIIARLAFIKRDYVKAIQQIEKNKLHNTSWMPNDLIDIYTESKDNL